MTRPICAVTMGDPAGIGPEILVKAARDPKVRAACHVVAVADYDVISDAIRVTGVDLSLLRLEGAAARNRETITACADDTLPILDLQNVDLATLKRGTVHPDYGRAAYESITRAIEYTTAGYADAVVTNPIHKEAINAAGIAEAGHTEIFAKQTNTTHYAMMLVHDQFRVVHVSTHVSLLDACRAVTADRVLSVIRLTAGAIDRLRDGVQTIAVAGLNPHAGEHGLFGREEIEEIIPAVNAAHREGIDVVGPLPADTLFPRAMSGEFAAVIAMYHDQGHVPFKLIGFTVDPATGGFTAVNGVNITLGLPIVRTSVDHGTAFDIAGTGKASHESLVEAIEYAARLGGNAS